MLSGPSGCAEATAAGSRGGARRSQGSLSRTSRPPSSDFAAEGNRRSHANASPHWTPGSTMGVRHLGEFAPRGVVRTSNWHPPDAPLALPLSHSLWPRWAGRVGYLLACVVNCISVANAQHNTSTHYRAGGWDMFNAGHGGLFVATLARARHSPGVVACKNPSPHNPFSLVFCDSWSLAGA